MLSNTSRWNDMCTSRSIPGANASACRKPNREALTTTILPSFPFSVRMRRASSSPPITGRRKFIQISCGWQIRNVSTPSALSFSTRASNPLCCNARSSTSQFFHWFLTIQMRCSGCPGLQADDSFPLLRAAATSPVSACRTGNSR